MGRIPGDTTCGVSQLLRYEPALQAKAKDWTIRKLLVARETHPDVEARAKKNDVEVWKFGKVSLRREG